MKAKIALLCVLTLLFSCIGPMMPASAEEAWQTGFKASKSETSGVNYSYSFQNGIVTLGPNTIYTKSPANLPSKYIATATVRVAKFGSTGHLGINMGNNLKRTGVYISKDRVRPFSDNPADSLLDIGTTWHDYRFHVDGSSHKIYVDNKLVATGSTATKDWNQINFFVVGDSVLEIDNLKFQYEDSGNSGEVDPKTVLLTAEPDEEYTPEFTVDWSDPESYKDWSISNHDQVIIDAEEGILTINPAVNGSKLAVGSPMHIHQIERSPLAPENWDLEFDLQVIRAEDRSFQFKAVPAGTNNWYYVGQDRLQHYDGDSEEASVQVNIGNKWNHWKIETRGDKQTLFFNGRALHDCNIHSSSSNKAVIRFILQKDFGDFHVNLGKIHYKPYFPEVELTAPANNSSYVEGSDIVFEANPETKVDYVDYYVDGVNIGRGYAPDYKYVFKNSKMGTYEVAAGVGGKITQAKNEITVVKGFTAELKLNKTEAKLGETVNASIKYDSLNAATKPNKVEYFVDGNKVGTSTTAPFNMLLKDIKIGTSQVEARIYNKNGAMASDKKRVTIYDTKASSGKLAREYEIDYNYGSGNGVINITDGYYKLDMKHSAGLITYESYTGTETYALGAGKYKVAVISGIAEVYYNGHYAFSFFMPKTAEEKISYSGISNFKISGNGTKVRYLSKKWENKNVDITGFDMPYYFNLEFDKKDTSDETIVVYDGEHRIPLEFKDGKINTVNFKVETGKADPFVINSEVKAGYYKLVCSKGLCQLYIDNQYVDSFKSYPQPGITRVQRTMSNPSSSTILEIKGIDDIYYHDDDFNGNTEVDSLDYWIPNEDTLSASLEGTAKNSHMKLEGTGTYLLNAQTYNTDTKWRAKVTAGGEFHVATRLYTGRYHVKAGYDFENMTWYTHERYDVNSTPHSPENAKYNVRMDFEEGPEMTLDEWHDFELHTDYSKLVLKMDGEVVIETDKLQSDYYGHIGFGVTNGTVLIDDFSYEGECGAFGELRSRIVNGPTGVKISDFAELSDGTVIAHYYNKQYRTTDGGENWVFEDATTSIQSLGHTLRNHVQIKFQKDGGLMYCYASLDDGQTWEKRGCVQTRDISTYDNFVMLNGSFEEASDGTIYVGADEGRSEYYSQSTIYYSRDEGWTWHQTELQYGNVKTGEHDSTHTHFSGWNTQELTFEELPDGKTIRNFGRTGNGFVYYQDSTDGGKTWGEYRPTQLLQPLCTYNVEQDLKDPNVYYAVTVHCAATESYYHLHQPRNRFVLLMSRDGMKSWEFVATLNETYTWRNFDKCNFSTKAYGDTLYIVDDTLYEGGSIVYAVDTTNLKSRKRLESAHPVKRQHFVEGTGSIQYKERLDEMSFLPEISGGATIYGNNINITVKDGMYDAETISKVFGAAFVKSGQAVTFKIGEGTVKFTEGSANYVVNGETKTYTSACMKNGYFNIEACAEAFDRQLDNIDGINVIDISNK